MSFKYCSARVAHFKLRWVLKNTHMTFSSSAFCSGGDTVDQNKSSFHKNPQAEGGGNAAPLSSKGWLWPGLPVLMSQSRKRKRFVILYIVLPKPWKPSKTARQNLGQITPDSSPKLRQRLVAQVLYNSCFPNLIEMISGVAFSRRQAQVTSELRSDPAKKISKSWGGPEKLVRSLCFCPFFSQKRPPTTPA